MGPPSYMRPIVDWNVVMRRMPVFWLKTNLIFRLIQLPNLDYPSNVIKMRHLISSRQWLCRLLSYILWHRVVCRKWDNSCFEEISCLRLQFKENIRRTEATAHTLGKRRYSFRFHGFISQIAVIFKIASSLTLRWLMSYIYGAPILDVSRSHTTTQHSR